MNAVHHVMGVDGSYPLVVALWLLPLLGAVLCWTFGPQLKARAGWLASGLLLASFVLAVLSWSSGTQSSAARSARTRPCFRGTGVRFRPPDGSARALVGADHHRRGFLDPPVFHRLHGRGRCVRAILRLHELLRLCDAHAGALRQLRRIARRLGPRRARIVFLDWFLVLQTIGGGGGAQSVRHQRRRRRRHHVRHPADFQRGTFGGMSGMPSPRPDRTARRCSWASASRSLSARRRSRRKSRCTPGFRTRWKARHRSPR